MVIFTGFITIFRVFAVQGKLLNEGAERTRKIRKKLNHYNAILRILHL